MPNRERPRPSGLVRLLLLLVMTACLVQCRTISEKPSGFQPSYTGFHPYPPHPHTRIWEAPDLDLARYDKVLIPPVVVYIGPEGQGKGIQPKTLTMLTDRFHAALMKHFDGLTTDTPGPDVAGLRAAITGLIPGEPVTNVVTTAIPVAFVFGNAAELFGEAAPGVGEVAAEAMIVDSVTGDRLVGAISTHVGAKYDVWDAASTWDQVEDAFDDWAANTRKFWDVQHAAGASPGT